MPVFQTIISAGKMEKNYIFPPYPNNIIRA